MKAQRTPSPQQGQSSPVSERGTDLQDTLGNAELARRMPQADLVETMMEMGYDEALDGSLVQKTTYGGFDGMGNPRSDGHGGVWLTGQRLPPRSVPWDEPLGLHSDGPAPPEYAWQESRRRADGSFEGGRADVARYEPNGEYHCVGAVSAAFEAMGLYGEGARDDTHWGPKHELEGKSYLLRQIAEVGTISAPKEGEGTWMERQKKLIRETVGQTKGLLAEKRKVAEKAADAAKLQGAERADFVLRHSYDALMQDEGRDERLEGATLALQLGGMGSSVNPADVKPGDVCQTWKGRGGHNTVVQVVEAVGLARVDETGLASPLGDWKQGPFRMDETTLPGTVGTHRVVAVRRLGAHSKGGADYNQGEKKAHDGIFTGPSAKIGDTTKYDLEFYARPDNSPWAGWFPSVTTLPAPDRPRPLLRPGQDPPE
jgi:hypothetical protein